MALSDLRAERREAVYRFRIDPICLGTGAPTGRECLDLRWRQLPGLDPGCVQACPKPPFLTACGFETDESPPIPGGFCQFHVAGNRIRQPKPMAVRQTMGRVFKLV